MRLIDADALFNWNGKKLSDAVKYGNKDSEQQHWGYSTLMMYEIADEIDDAPTVDAAPVWINVEDRLPEDEALILAYHPRYLIPTPEQKCDVDRITIKFGWHCRKSALGITHWMSLPSPPGAKMLADSECGSEGGDGNGQRG